VSWFSSFTLLEKLHPWDQKKNESFHVKELVIKTHPF